MPAGARAAEIEVLLKLQNEMGPELERAKAMFRGLGGVAGDILKGVGTGFAIAGTAAAGYAIHSAMVALRADEMNVALGALAKANNVNVASLNNYVGAIRHQGIEMGVAQNLVAQFVQGHLDLAKSTDLARVAQDAAVISGQNSTQTLAQLVDGIRTQNIEILRGAGITISAEGAYERYAKAHGTTVAALSETTKQQILLDEVLREGTKVQGAYAAAMETPSKQLRSIPRLLDDININIGKAFLPAVGKLIHEGYEMAKSLAAATEKGKPLAEMLERVGKVAEKVVKPLGDAAEKARIWIEALKPEDVGRATAAFEKFGPAVTGTALALSGPMLGSIPVLGQFLGLLAPAAVAVGVWIALPPEVRKSIEGFLPKLSDLRADLGKLKLLYDDIVEPFWRNLRQVIADSAPSFQAFQRDLRDLQSVVRTVTSSGEFAGLVAFFIVYFPQAISVGIATLQLMIDQFRITVTSAAGMAKVMLDIAHGDFEQAWKDASETVRLNKENVVRYVQDMQTAQEVAARAGSAETAAQYEEMRKRVSATMASMWSDAQYYGPAVGSSLALGVRSGVDVNFGAAADSARRLVAHAANEAADQARGDAPGVGAAMAWGIRDGFSGNAWWIGNAARQAVSHAMQEAREAIQAGSPSLVWARQVGLPMAQGVARGLAEGAQAVGGAARSLVTPGPAGVGGLAWAGRASEYKFAGGARILVENHLHLDGREVAEVVSQYPDLLGGAIHERMQLRSGFRGRT